MPKRTSKPKAPAFDERIQRESASFPRGVIAEIQRAADTGIYDIRGFGAKRKLPHFDDLLFLGASVSRYPLEGYRERCATDVTLGTRFAKRPIELEIPITIAGGSSDCCCAWRSVRRASGCGSRTRGSTSASRARASPRSTRSKRCARASHRPTPGAGARTRAVSSCGWNGFAR